MWVPDTDIAQGGASTLILNNNVAGIDNIPSATGLANNGTGLENPANNKIDLILKIAQTGFFVPAKYFSATNGGVKLGKKKVSPGQIFASELFIYAEAQDNYKQQVCDNIDTSKLEFVGKSTTPTLKLQDILQNDYFSYNPFLQFGNSKLNGNLSNQIKIEYSTTPHTSTAPADLMVSKCNDDLDGNGSYDWSTTIPANPSLVTKVRISE